MAKTRAGVPGRLLTFISTRIKMLIEALIILKQNPRLFAYDCLILVVSYAAAFSLILLNNLISPTSAGLFGVPIIILPVGFIIGSISMLLLIALYNDFKNRGSYRTENGLLKFLGSIGVSTNHMILLVVWGLVYLMVSVIEDLGLSGAYTIHFYIPGFIFPMALIPYVLERKIPNDAVSILIILLQFYLIAINRLFIPATVAYSPIFNLIFHVAFFTITTVYVFVRYESPGADKAVPVRKRRR